MSTLQCDIVSAEESVFSGDANMVVAAGTLGDVGIAYGHAPLLTSLKPGPVRVLRDGGEEEIYYISGGYLEVQPGVVSILADTAVRADDVDAAAAEEAQKAAEQALSDSNSDVDYSLAQTRLAEAAAQLRTIQAIRKKLGK